MHDVLAIGPCLHLRFRPSAFPSPSGSFSPRIGCRGGGYRRLACPPLPVWVRVAEELSDVLFSPGRDDAGCFIAVTRREQMSMDSWRIRAKHVGSPGGLWQSYKYPSFPLTISTSISSSTTNLYTPSIVVVVFLGGTTRESLHIKEDQRAPEATTRCSNVDQSWPGEITVVGPYRTFCQNVSELMSDCFRLSYFL